MPLLNNIARILAVVIAVYLTIRFLDLHHRGVLGELTRNTTESWMFGLEIAFMLFSMLMLFRGRIRHRPGALYAAAVLYIFGFIMHRLNISTTGLEASSGVKYIPRWSEISITLFIIAAGFALFRLAAQYLPVFEHSTEEATVQPAARPQAAVGEFASTWAEGD